MRIVAIALLVWSVAPARAEVPFDLLLPIDCRPGVDCWILRYMDHDPGPGVRDYACGELTGDGHKGTDIAISNLAVMAEGVEVRAAAAGVVDGLRDGMPDQSLEESGREAVDGKECGNGIRLDHGDGWTSWYCHLRRGSLMVAQGDRVEPPDRCWRWSGSQARPRSRICTSTSGTMALPWIPSSGWRPGRAVVSVSGHFGAHRCCASSTMPRR